jgi:hypothetical protein
MADRVFQVLETGSLLYTDLKAIILLFDNKTKMNLIVIYLMMPYERRRQTAPYRRS